MKYDRFACDVVVIGGGIAGCFAAIRARDKGASVILLDKADTRSSGGAWGGVDDVLAYVPEVHEPLGCSIEDMVDEQIASVDGFVSRSLQTVIAANSARRLEDLEKLGVRMRDENGNLRTVRKEEKAAPFWIAIEGEGMKEKLTRELRKKGARIINRTMAFDLVIGSAGLLGVVAFSTREERMVFVQSKSVILATGMTNWLYKNPAGLLFNTIFPNQTGDGRAMAFRAGIELVGMEWRFIRVGPLPFERGTRGASFLGSKFLDAKREPLDPSISYNVRAMVDTIEKGKGPIFLDCSGSNDEQIEITRQNMYSEGARAMVDYWDAEHIDLRKTQIQFGTYEPILAQGLSGISINERCETSMPGVFAAGEETGGTIRNVAKGAAVQGWIAGESAAEYSKQRSLMQYDEAAINERFHTLLTILESKTGSASWKDILLSLQNIMNYHLGPQMSEDSLTTALQLVSELKEQARARMKAENFHELMHCVQVLNLIDTAEASIAAARERRESRPRLGHIRSDYPEPNNKEFRKFLIVRKEGTTTKVYSKPIDP
ncbi:MAG: FAD-dependent oxidoreductase [Nitrososphaerota archaeon]|nr:FAD-dependent oxidoreductase [Nitrososphaerota archaeon]